MKILITGFEPFGGEKINPAWEAVNSLPSKIDDIDIFKLQLPTVFRASGLKLFEAIDLLKPDVVITAISQLTRPSLKIVKTPIFQHFLSRR